MAAVARWVSASEAIEGPRTRPRPATEADAALADRINGTDAAEAFAYRGADPAELVTAADEVADLFAALLDRPSWMADAACAGMATETFFPGRGGDVEGPRQVCMSCPVKVECLDYALSTEDYPVGVWGGRTARQRKGEARPVPVRACEACGAQIVGRAGSRWCSKGCASHAARKRRLAG